MIEHVRDPPAFVAACCALVRPGGGLVVSTVNRTPASLALAIVAAEVCWFGNDVAHTKDLWPRHH